MELNGTLGWLVGRGVALLIGVVILLVIYRIGVSAIHRIVPAVINAQATHLPSGSSSADEVSKRITTIEDLLRKLLRVGVLAGFVVVALGVFELWVVLAGIALLIVAIVFATRDVVLDYVMGFLILVEGPYFKGDYLVVDGHPGDRGGRRGDRSAAHAPARCDGFVRCRVERVHPTPAQPDPPLLGRRRGPPRPPRRPARRSPGDGEPGRQRDAGRIPAGWIRSITDSPTDVWVTGIGMDGATIRLQQRVPAGAQTAVASEFRRRLAAALVAGSIGTGRWDTPLPIVSQPDACRRLDDRSRLPTSALARDSSRDRSAPWSRWWLRDGPPRPSIVGRLPRHLFEAPHIPREGHPAGSGEEVSEGSVTDRRWAPQRHGHPDPDVTASRRPRRPDPDDGSDRWRPTGLIQPTTSDHELWRPDPDDRRLDR